MFESFSTLQNQNVANPINWILWLTALGIIIAIFVLIYAIKHFHLNKKTLEKKNQELKIEITKISAKPWIKNGQGGWISTCYIVIDIKNPSTEDNEATITILRPVTNNIFARLENKQLPALRTTSFKIELSYEEFNSEEKIKTIKGKKLLLIIKDIHRRELKQHFVFENMPYGFRLRFPSTRHCFPMFF